MALVSELLPLDLEFLRIPIPSQHKSANELLHKGIWQLFIKTQMLVMWLIIMSPYKAKKITGVSIWQKLN